MSDMLAGFEPLQDEFYPGSKQRRRESVEQKRERKRAERAEVKDDESWDAHPKKRTVKGVEFEMFPVGALAKALNRDPVTIRAWIRKRWLPKNQWQDPPVIGSRGDAGRRLWTRAQVERIVVIAYQEGLLAERPPRIQQTGFTRRIFAEWKDLRWK
jgi:hypothetical protein